MRATKANAIIVAAGEGERMGMDKISLEIVGKPVIIHTMEQFQSSSLVSEMVIVLSSKNLSNNRLMRQIRSYGEKVSVCEGGPTRQESVMQGLQIIGDSDLMIVHDGARPCVTKEIIEKGIDLMNCDCLTTAGVISGIQSTDTIKEVNERGTVIATLDRKKLWEIQTPGVFVSEVLRRAYAHAEDEVTDDATLVENLGCIVKVYPGSRYNIKLTTPEDITIATYIILRRTSLA
ncbi:MAG: 2-C-methyl-D-erythritol 4-phosphate cytidylyltransferase [Candidatus Micrarchaeaceae archaeon]